MMPGNPSNISSTRPEHEPLRLFTSAATTHAILTYALLACVTFAVYLPVLRLDFVNFDDNAYVTGNGYVSAGLTWRGVMWAFRNFHSSNWHPVTWISHMVDCQLYGLRPAGHHMTNALIHIANSLLLFRLLKGMIGALWRSAFVAALFAQKGADDPAAHYHLALALTGQGKSREAVEHYLRSLGSFQNVPAGLNNLAWILATYPDPQVRNGAEAVIPNV
jgi:hypothetical protein